MPVRSLAVLLTALYLFVGCGNSYNEHLFTISPETPQPEEILVSLQVTPETSTIVNGHSEAFNALGTLIDGTELDLTSAVVWSTSNSAVASVDATGLVTGVSAGSAVVNASLGEHEASAEVTITSATISSISVTPTTPVIGIGLAQSFTAMATLSDGNTLDVTDTATWNSATPSVATIDNQGLATSVSPGQSVITATRDGISGSATLTVSKAYIVSIAIDPVNALSAPESKRQYHAIATLSDSSIVDVTSQVVWSSSNSEVQIANDDHGPNQVGQARISRDATIGDTATITATLGSFNTTSTLTIGLFAYLSNLDSDTVSAFSIDPATGALTQVGSPVAVVGDEPTAVLVHPNGIFVYVTSYNDNTVSFFTIDPTTGALTLKEGVETGYSPISAVLSPSGLFAYTVNVSEDNISTLAIDPITGAISEVGSRFDLGGTPTSIAIDPSGRFLYVVFMFESTVSSFAIDQSTGALTEVGAPVATGFLPGDVTVESSGRFAYVVNSYGDSISMYTIDQSTGELTPIGAPIPTGVYPFSIASDPSGRFVYAVNQDDNDVSIYAIDQDSGLLSFVATQSVGNTPIKIAIEPAGRFAYLTNAADGSVSTFAIDQTTGALTEVGTPMLSGGNWPYSIVTTP